MKMMMMNDTTEKRLIRLDEAVAFMNQIETDNLFDNREDILEKCVNVLSLCRTVDAVEVVRCKDCKHYKRVQGAIGGWCDCELTPFDMDPNDFCSCGETEESK